MKKNQIMALIFGSILIGFGLGYEVSLFLVPTPEPEIVQPSNSHWTSNFSIVQPSDSSWISNFSLSYEKPMFPSCRNIFYDFWLTGKEGKITLTNLYDVVFSGPMLEGVSLELINCSKIVVICPFIWTNNSYGMKLVGCANISIIDFRILDANIGIVVFNSSDIYLGSSDLFDEEGNPIYLSKIENCGTYAFEVLDSYRVTIAGVNVTGIGSNYIF